MKANTQASKCCIPTMDTVVVRLRLPGRVFCGRRQDGPDPQECIGNPGLMGSNIAGHVELVRIGVVDMDVVRIGLDHIVLAHRNELDRIGFRRMD